MAPDNLALLTDLVKDAIRRIEQLADKMDFKLDAMEHKLSTDNNRFKEGIEDKVEKMEIQLYDNTHRLAKMEQTATIFSWLVTGGVASLIGVVTWLYGIFRPSTHN